MSAFSLVGAPAPLTGRPSPPQQRSPTILMLHTRNFKSQISRYKQITNSKLQILNSLLIVIWSLIIVCFLVIGYCNFLVRSTRIFIFGIMLEPRYIFGAIFQPAEAGRSVSYYAFFKGWLLLSQPPDCLRKITTFPT